MVQNKRLKKTEFSCLLQRPKLISTKILGDLSLATKIKQPYKNCRKILKSGTCNPIATSLYAVLRDSSILECVEVNLEMIENLGFKHFCIQPW